jgi:ribonuclease P protein component
LPRRRLYLSFVLTLSKESGAAPFHAQAYIPAQPAQAKQNTRLSHAHEDPGRPEGSFPPPRQGAQAGRRQARLPRVASLVPPFLTVETPGRPAQHAGILATGALEIDTDAVMPAKKKAGFARSSRLLRHADFERVYKQGRRHFSATMTVFYCPSRQAPPTQEKDRALPQALRVGFTVSRALGGAVVRNRMKRRLREAVRLSFPAAGFGADVVINPKKTLLAADFAVVRAEVARAFAKIEQDFSRGFEAGTTKNAEGRKTKAADRF